MPFRSQHPSTQEAPQEISGDLSAEDSLSPPPPDISLEQVQFPEREDLPIVKPSKPISPFMRFSSKIWAQVRRDSAACSLIET